MAEREFAFSIDNLRPLGIAPWFALHDDDDETRLLANTIRVIRSAPEFRRDFDARLDQILAELGLCPRGEDGYLGNFEQGISPEDCGSGAWRWVNGWITTDMLRVPSQCCDALDTRLGATASAMSGLHRLRLPPWAGTLVGEQESLSTANALRGSPRNSG